MNTRQALESTLQNAMRNKDSATLNAVRLVLSSIKLTEVETGKQLDDAGMIAVIQKEIKSRREAMADAQKANRADLIEKAENDITLLEGFLPKQLSPEELTSIAAATILELQASSVADMGKVMKAMIPKVQGRASGDAISQAVKKLLTG